YNELDDLPPIPESIAKIRRMINDPKSDIIKIGELVKQDASLTADILRVANSAWYMSRSHIDNVDRAIAMIGLRRLSAITLTIGAKKVIKDRYPAMEQTWRHSYKCAFFAMNLMKLKSKHDEDIELAYVSGLLHDMGKFVILSLSPSLIEGITAMSKAKHVSITEIEKQALGFNHAEIGQKVATRWKFPPLLTLAIGFHHAPLSAPDEDKTAHLVYTTYLANILSKEQQDSEDIMNSVEAKVLDYYDMADSETFKTHYDKLNDQYAIAPEIKYF
ncbi:MAG: HDOD domain-containing protein, partial [Spirochaetota bacterium]|nr:HDOD domain-containing protein [Spirochaetota bacterium]